MADQRSKMKSKKQVLQLKPPRLCFVLIAGLCVLAASIYSVQTATCPSSVPPSAEKTTEQYKVTGYTYTLPYGIVGGPVSSSLYYMYSLSTPYNVAVRKVDASGSQTWITSFAFMPILKSMSVDAAEQNVYLACMINPIVVVKLAASNGLIINQHQFTGISGYNVNINIFPLTDLSGYFFIGFDSSTNVAKICKYTFSSSSAQCQAITNMNTGYGHLMLSNSQFFILGVAPASPYDLQMYKITFSMTSVNWASQIACTGTCTAANSGSMLSSDGSIIYSLFIFGATKYLYFCGLTVSDGSVATARFKSSVGVSAVNGEALNGDYIVATTYSPISLVIYSISTSAFTIKSFSSNLYECGVEPSSGRFIVNGRMGSNGYTAKFFAQSINLNSDFSSGSWSMEALSAGTDDIVAQSGVTIDIPDASFTPAVGTYVNQNVTYTLVSSTTSDVYYQIISQSISVVELTTSSITADLSCSFSGNTEIIYTILSSSTAPSWVQINASTGKLTITAPGVSSDSAFSFYIVSSFPGTSISVQKLINLTVTKCQVQNCQVCSSSNASTCDTCSSGYTINSGSCIIDSNTANDADQYISEPIKVTIITTLGVSLCTVAIVSFANPASIASFWSIINQCQLLLLLLLTRTSIPLDVQNVILGFEFTLNIASYFGFLNIGFIKSIIEEFHFELSNQSLESIGIDSDSSIYNISSAIILTLGVIAIHLLTLLFYKLIPTEVSEGRCKLIKRMSIKLVKKLFLILTFGWYIRYILETNQYILISCINEMYSFTSSDSKRIISLLFSILVLLLCCCLIIFVSWLSLSSYKVIKDQHNKLGEIFSGVKMVKKSKLYVSILLMRRAIFVILLITLQSIQSWIQVSMLGILQICYLIYIIILRPFDEKRSNIIEIVNEIFISILLNSLIFLNSESAWTSTLSQIYMWIIFSNAITILIIITFDNFRTLILLVKKRCVKSSNFDQIDVPVTNANILKRGNIQDPSSINMPHFRSSVYREESKE